MGLLRAAALALFAFNTFQLASAAKASPEEETLLSGQQALDIEYAVPAVHINTTFPAAEIFGVKLVNGQKNTAFLTVENAEEEAVKVHFIGGALWSLGPDSASVRNLSMVRAGPITIRPGETHRLEYGINTELHPQDLRLLLAAVVEHPAGQFSEITAYNGTVSIVEAPISIFDPQMIFLYLFLGALFGGTCWFIYRTWVRQLFPHGKKPAAKTSKAKKADAPKPAAADAADAAAAASGAKPYDESWIPPQHLQRPEAKRVRSGTPKTKSK